MKQGDYSPRYIFSASCEESVVENNPPTGPQYPSQPPYQPPPSQPAYPYPAQPQYPYPYSQPLAQPPAQPPKKSRRTLWIVLGSIGGVIILCCVIASIASAIGNGNKNNQSGSSATATTGPTATPAPPTATPKPKVWTTIKTFSGNGSQQTADVTVPNQNWRMEWSCVPNSFYGDSYNIIVAVDPVDTSQLGDPAAINTLCSTTNTSGMTNIHDVSGTLYLDVTSEAAWTIKVEVFE